MRPETVRLRRCQGISRNLIFFICISIQYMRFARRCEREGVKASRDIFKRGTQFARFTRKKVQILTQKALWQVGRTRQRINGSFMPTLRSASTSTTRRCYLRAICIVYMYIYIYILYAYYIYSIYIYMYYVINHYIIYTCIIWYVYDICYIEIYIILY